MARSCFFPFFGIKFWGAFGGYLLEIFYPIKWDKIGSTVIALSCVYKYCLIFSMPPQQLIILSKTILLINRVLIYWNLKSSCATQSYDISSSSIWCDSSWLIYHTSPIAAIYSCYPTPTTPTHSTRKYIKASSCCICILDERTYLHKRRIIIRSDYVLGVCLSLPSLLLQ